MPLFQRKNVNTKAISSVVWRDATGNIRCLGDRCVQKKCDDTCPIWLATKAAGLLQIGQREKALEVLEKAAQIAPDFYDAWNNMGAIYGGAGNYQKAYDCYLKAHNIKVKRDKPVYGLALTSRDLGKYEECILWCDEYARINPNGLCKEIRKTAQEALKKQREQNDK